MANELNQFILQQAKSNGICSDWATLIEQAGSKEELMQMYVKGIDFCMEHNFPNNNDLLEQMGNDGLVEYGIYIDQTTNIINTSFLVLLGSCRHEGVWTEYSASQAYVKSKSNLRANVTDNAFLVIDCFDESVVHVSAHNESKVVVNIYGNAKVTHACTGNAIVKIVNKLKYSY